MNSVVVLVLGFLVAIVGYRFYAKYIDTKIMKADPKRATPAKMYMDGVEFMPTSKNILFGYQFKSIAGAAPIIGPILAIQWGWLPALIWILAGAFFTGVIGSFGAIFTWDMAHTDQTSPDLELPKWIVYLCIPLGSYLMSFRFLQVAWGFARTGELPKHDVAHVEGVDLSASPALHPSEGVAGARP